MRTHEQFADELALYALNELHGDELQEFEQHLETCAACRRELQAMRSDLALLGLSAVGPRPPGRSKERLMRAIAAEPRGETAPTTVQTSGRRNFWLAWIPAAIALAVIAFAISLRQSNQGLHDQLAELRNRYNDQKIQLAQAQENMRLLLAPDAVHVSLTPQNASHHPSATAIFSPSMQRMTLMASNLPPTPPGKAYELWVIPPMGAPVNAGVFKPDEHGNAMMLDHAMPIGVEPKTFALTVEDEAGSDKPTSPIVIAGSMGEGQ
ncbi:MAG: anti-sigma factor [Candidatus Korobacteraceae bacterium]